MSVFNSALYLFVFIFLHLLINLFNSGCFAENVLEDHGLHKSAEADCKIYEGNVKVAFINDSQPHHVFRLGYVYGKLMNTMPVSNDAIKTKFKEMLQRHIIDVCEDHKVRKWFEGKKAMLASLEPGEFHYVEVPPGLVNRRNKVVGIVFQTCYHNATIGMYVKKAAHRAKKVEAMNDWSKDFELVGKCEESSLIRIEEESGNHSYNALVNMASILSYRGVSADNALPVRIGIRTLADQEIPDYIMLQAHRYMYGFSDPPRAHLQESKYRIYKWGRWLMDKEEGYKPAQMYNQMSVTFVHVNSDHLRALGFEMSDQEISLLIVQPELLQMFYTCRGFNIYMPRFKVTQTVEVHYNDTIFPLRLDFTAQLISLDGRTFRVPLDPNEVNMEEIIEKGK